VPPAEFAAWVAAKGGTMPAAGQASNKVIPQPGAAGSAAATAEAEGVANGAGPVENATVTAPTTTQGATQSSDGAAQTGL
jgi:cytochrome c oxidase subunit 2